MDNKLETMDNPEQNNNETGWESVAAMATQPETVSQPEKVLTADNNVYREIAKNALKNWNGLSEEEASKKVSGASVEELEGQVYAQGSIKAALNGINKALKERELFDEGDGLDKDGLFDDILNREKNSDKFQDLGEKLKEVEDKEDFTLDVLSSIHDDWIKSNLKKLNDPNRVDKRYQFMPLEFIGIDEAKADLVFVEPIFEAAGMEIDEAKLGYKYAKYSQYSYYLKDDFMHAGSARGRLSSEVINGKIGRRDEDIIDGVSQYFRRLQSRYDFKIDLLNVKDKEYAEFCESYSDRRVVIEKQKKFYAAEVADQVCGKLV